MSVNVAVSIFSLKLACPCETSIRSPLKGTEQSTYSDRGSLALEPLRSFPGHKVHCEQSNSSCSDQKPIFTIESTKEYEEDQISEKAVISNIFAPRTAGAIRLFHPSLPDSVGESTGGTVESHCPWVTEKQTEPLTVTKPIFSSTTQKNNTHVSCVSFAVWVHLPMSLW